MFVWLMYLVAVFQSNFDGDTWGFGGHRSIDSGACSVVNIGNVEESGKPFNLSCCVAIY